MPKLRTLDEIRYSDLPPYVELPKEYFPPGIGPGGFDPQSMYLTALVRNKSVFNSLYETKSWVMLFLLDNVDWERVINNVVS